MISIRGLVKSYGKVEVLRDLDLEVARGEIIGIIGVSGSGKSTLLRCVNQLEEYEGGEIKFEGTVVGYRVDGKGRRKREADSALCAVRTSIGMVFQSFNLFPHLTVLENVVEGPIMVKREAKAGAVDMAMQLLERVGLKDKARVYPSTLSGGQQQRAAIARALAMKPKAMLFDEPTSSLDPELVGEVLDVMKGLAQDGMTMLIATHEMSFIREVAHRIAFIDGGQVIEEGPPSTIFGAPRQQRTIDFLRRVRVAVG